MSNDLRAAFSDDQKDLLLKHSQELSNIIMDQLSIDVKKRFDSNELPENLIFPVIMGALTASLLKVANEAKTLSVQSDGVHWVACGLCDLTDIDRKGVSETLKILSTIMNDVIETPSGHSLNSGKMNA